MKRPIAERIDAGLPAGSRHHAPAADRSFTDDMKGALRRPAGTGARDLGLSGSFPARTAGRGEAGPSHAA